VIFFFIFDNSASQKFGLTQQARKFLACWLIRTWLYHMSTYDDRWYQLINRSSIEIPIKMNPEKGVKLKSRNLFELWGLFKWCFFGKVVLLGVKEFRGLHDDLKMKKDAILARKKDNLKIYQKFSLVWWRSNPLAYFDGITVYIRCYILCHPLSRVYLARSFWSRFSIAPNFPYFRCCRRAHPHVRNFKFAILSMAAGADVYANVSEQQFMTPKKMNFYFVELFLLNFFMLNFFCLVNIYFFLNHKKHVFFDTYFFFSFISSKFYVIVRK